MKYPLEAARTLRAQAVAAAEAGLGSARQDEATAQGAVLAAQAALESHQALLHQTRSEAGVKPAGAAELLRQGAYDARLRAERAALAERRQVAEEHHAAAKAATRAAQSALAEARAAQEAVERHFEGWVAEQRKVEERRSEAESDDLVSAAFGRGRE